VIQHLPGNIQKNQYFLEICAFGEITAIFIAI